MSKIYIYILEIIQSFTLSTSRPPQSIFKNNKFLYFFLLKYLVVSINHYFSFRVKRFVQYLILNNFWMPPLKFVYISSLAQKADVLIAAKLKLADKYYKGLKVVSHFIAVRNQFGLNATTSNFSIRFLRPVYSYDNVLLNFNYFKFTFLGVHLFLKIVDCCIIISLFYIIWCYWANYVVYIYLTFGLFCYICFQYSAGIDYPINYLYNISYNNYQKQFGENCFNPFDYYNIRFIDFSYLQSFANNFTYSTDNFLPYMYNHIIIFYLLHVIFFFFSFIQLRNLLLLNSQMYLETNFQIPLFYKWDMFFNLNPYEDNYYRVFVSNLEKKNIYFRKTLKKKTTFFIATNLNLDLFDHPRYLLRFQRGQLNLIQYTNQLKIITILLFSTIPFLFYMLPLFTCLLFWVLLLFLQWFFLRNPIYAEIYYDNLIQPKLKMINFQTLENNYTKTKSLSSVLYFFYLNYVRLFFFKIITLFKTKIIFPHYLDMRFWAIYLQKLSIILKKLQIYDYLFFFFSRISLFFRHNIFIKNIKKLIVFCLTNIIRCLIHICFFFNFFVCKNKKLRRKLNIYLQQINEFHILMLLDNLFYKLSQYSLDLLTISGRSKIRQNVLKGFINVIIKLLQHVRDLYQQYFVFSTKTIKTLDKEFQLYGFKKKKQQELTWHNDIVQNINGTFYKIVKIQKNKIYGFEIKFLDLKEEKTYYYGKKLFLCNLDNFFTTFPLLDPNLVARILQFEDFEDLNRFIVFSSKFKEFLIGNDGEDDAQEKGLDETLRAISVKTKHYELNPEIDFLGKKIKKRWSLTSGANNKRGETIFKQPYRYWINEDVQSTDTIYDDVGLTLEDTDLFDFSKEKIDEMFFEKIAQAELKIPEFQQEFFLHTEEFDFDEEEFWDWPDEYSQPEELADSDYEYMTQLQQTLDYWMRLNMIIVLHFGICLICIICLFLYFLFDNQQQIFFFFFDFSNFFFVDFYYWWITHQIWPTSGNKTIFVYHYIKIVYIQKDNIFATHPTNIYGFCLHNIFDKIIDLYLFKKKELCDSGFKIPHADKYLDFFARGRNRHLRREQFKDYLLDYKKLGFVEYLEESDPYYYLTKDCTMGYWRQELEEEPSIFYKWIHYWNRYRLNFYFYYFNVIHSFMLLYLLLQELFLNFWFFFFYLTKITKFFFWNKYILFFFNFFLYYRRR